MSFRVEIENFQSVTSADLEVDGVTTITGQNNTGKSAIMRAIRGVFTNPGNGARYIHYGKDFFRVKFTFGDGKYVLWERLGRVATKGKKKGQLVDLKTNYEVNGVRYDGVGNSVPEAVLDQGVGPIVVGRDTVWPQLAKQVDDVYFLVNRPGSHVAEAVANVDNVAVLHAAMRSCDKDLREVTSELKVRRSDLSGHQDKLEAMRGLDRSILQVEAVESLHVMVTRLQTGLGTAKGLREKLQAAKTETSLLEPILKVECPDPSKVEELQGMVGESQALQSLRDRLKTSQEVVSRYQGIEELKIPEDEKASSLQAALKLQGELQEISSRMTEARSRVERLSGAENLKVAELSEVQDLQEAAQRLSELRRLKSQLEAAKRESSRFVQFQDVGELDLGDGLSGLQRTEKGLELYKGIRDRMTTARKAVQSQESKMKRAQEDVESVEKEMKEFISEHPKCPTCGQFRHQEAS